MSNAEPQPFNNKLFAHKINNDMKSNLVGHVFIKNLSSVCTNKSTHGNVIQASKPPPPETYNEKKLIHSST